MAGKFCTGVVTNNNFLPKESKAYCEGMQWRMQGTALQFPITDNPHLADSPAAITWGLGWIVADNAAPGAITPSDAPCCAVPNVVVAS